MQLYVVLIEEGMQMVTGQQRNSGLEEGEIAAEISIPKMSQLLMTQLGKYLSLRIDFGIFQKWVA